MEVRPDWTEHSGEEQEGGVGTSCLLWLMLVILGIGEGQR